MTLEWEANFPTDADLIIIAGPLGDIDQGQIARLWAYLSNGGRLLLLTDPLYGRTRALKSNSALFELMWLDMGLRARDDVVAMLGAPRFVSPSLLVTPKRDEPTPTLAPTFEAPELLINFRSINVSKQHPITANINSELAFFGARSFEYDAASQTVHLTPLVAAAETFYGEMEYNQYIGTGAAGNDPAVDINVNPLVVAVALESITGTRIVIIGDREFATNGAGLRTSPANSPAFLYPGNAQFLLNTIGWLLETDAPQLTFPTPGPTETVTITPTATPTDVPTSEATLEATTEGTVAP
jgi:hypothetical protein